MAGSDADIIVIGSGFGGAVMASRLVEAGKKVILLERGPWRDTIATRAAGIKNRKPLPRDGGMLGVLRSLRPPKGPKRLVLNKNGYLEMWIGDGAKCPSTSNVGGGSHIWAGMLARPTEGFWDSHAEGLSDAALAPHYERMTKDLCGAYPENPNDVPNHTDHAWEGSDLFTPLTDGEQPPVAILYAREGQTTDPFQDENGVTRQAMDMTKDNGMFGSPTASKTTLDAVLLIPAIEKGLDVRPLHEAERIRKTADGYSVDVRDHHRSISVSLTANRVVVASGTMNTNALLLNSQEAGDLPSMPALGTGQGMNGDIVADWPSDGRDARIGPPVLGRVKIAGHEDTAFYIMASGEPPPLPGFLRKKAQKKAASEFQIIAMSQDASDGRIWSDKGRIRFSFDDTGSPGYAATREAFDALGKASGRALRFQKKGVFAAHPCGGCRVSDDPQNGVVDGAGRVHGCPGLYVADAAAFPRSTGVPPSLSIAAWSSHVADHLLKEDH